MSDRLDALRAMLDDDPTDAFTRYALALELRSLGQVDEAIAELARLVKDAPDYVATYYQYGRALQARGRVTDAAGAVRQGIEVAAAASDAHTKGELEDLLGELEA